MSFSVPEYHPGFHITFNPHVLLAVTFSQTFLGLDHFGQAFVEWHSVGICLMSFSWLYWGYRSFGGGPQRWSAIFITSCQGNVSPTWLIAVDVDLGHLAEAVFVGCLHCEVTVSSSLSTLQPLQGNHYVQPTLQACYSPPSRGRSIYIT